MGGEEFLCCCRASTGQPAIERLDQLRQHDRRRTPGRTITDGVAVTASIGVASAPDDDLERGALLALADENLYRAKHDGRDRVVA